MHASASTPPLADTPVEHLGERTQAYTDTFIANVATFISATMLAIISESTAKSIHECERGLGATNCLTLNDWFDGKLQEVALFTVSFFLTSMAWRQHAVGSLGSVAPEANTLVNVFLVLPAFTFLPLLTSLSATYIKTRLGGVLMVVPLATLHVVVLLHILTLRRTASHVRRRAAALQVVATVGWAPVACVIGVYTQGWIAIPAYFGVMVLFRRMNAFRLFRTAADGRAVNHQHLKKRADAALGNAAAACTTPLQKLRGRKRFGVERLQAFLDGVFAICSTVVVLEVRAPAFNLTRGLTPHESPEAYVSGWVGKLD